MLDPRKLVAWIGTFLLVSVLVLSALGAYRGGSIKNGWAVGTLCTCGVACVLGLWALWAPRSSKSL